MARKKRVWYPGATFHVMSRGVRRSAIFSDISDYLVFLEYILMTRDKYPFKIHSICLMTNHFHFVIETGDYELSKIMQKILSTYAEEYNHKYHLTGHLFEGRFVAQLIEDERYFLEVSRYIHLNPVKAKMVDNPIDYEFSSYGIYVDDSDDNANKRGKNQKIFNILSKLVDTDRVLEAFHEKHREQYRLFVEEKISHEEHEQLIQKDIKENELWLPW